MSPIYHHMMPFARVRSRLWRSRGHTSQVSSSNAMIPSRDMTLLLLSLIAPYVSFQNFHPLFMGPDYIGPAVDHFQEISAKYPQVRYHFGTL